VDDNELTLRGFAEPLRASPAIELVAAIGHQEALAWQHEWAGADVVIVDAADEGSTADHFPGVKVVRRIRSCAGDRPTIVVVTGHFMNDGLRHRMADARADFFFLRANLRSAEGLRDVVLRPEAYRRGVPPVENVEMRRLLGVTDDADVENLVGYVDDHGLEDAFDPGAYKRREPRSRVWARHRRAITESSGITPRNVTTGGIPTKAQRWASMRQLSRIYRWAARIDQPDDGLSGRR
jgi:CheY-like chemotaxis protein